MNLRLPVILHNRRSVGASWLYWLIMPFLACGSGMVRVIGLWNFLLRGSTVTIGDTATLFPNILATRSGGIGCAWKILLLKNQMNVDNLLLFSILVEIQESQ